MSSIPVKFGNKIIQQKEQQKNLQLHYASLRRVRPITGKIAEYHDNVTINNNKKQMNLQNRFTEIQRENRMLLQKITSIMTKGSTIHTLPRNQGSQGKLNKSLNSSYRRKQMQSIELQNAKMLKRLKQKRSSYEVNKFNKDWRKRKQVIKNMANYPFILNDNLGVSRSGKAYSQYDFKRFNQNIWNQNQIVRMRKIDGVSFLVTVKIQGGKLFIIADCKQDRQVKVIQLPRTQAEEFLYHECKSNIQNVFDLLRYDKAEGVLYLVGADVQGVQQIRQLQHEKRNIKTADNKRRMTMPLNKQIRPISKDSIRKKKYDIQPLNEQQQKMQFSAKKQEALIDIDLGPPIIKPNWVKIQKRIEIEQSQKQQQEHQHQNGKDQKRKQNDLQEQSQNFNRQAGIHLHNNNNTSYDDDIQPPRMANQQNQKRQEQNFEENGQQHQLEQAIFQQQLI